jgi:hypothetical protein
MRPYSKFTCRHPWNRTYRATCLLHYTRCLKRTGNVNSFKKKQERGTYKTEKKRRKETMEALKRRAQEVQKTRDWNTED